MHLSPLLIRILSVFNNQVHQYANTQEARSQETVLWAVLYQRCIMSALTGEVTLRDRKGHFRGMHITYPL